MERNFQLQVFQNTKDSLPSFQKFSDRQLLQFWQNVFSIFLIFQVSKTRGIKYASLVSNGNLPSTNTDLGVSANLKFLLSSTTDLSNIVVDDSFKNIILEDGEGSLRVIQVVKETYLIVRTVKYMNEDVVDEALLNCINLIKLIDSLILKTSGSSKSLLK
jgi:hypothetical protein